MADHHEEEQLGTIYDARAARRLIRYLGPYKRMVVVALVLTIGLNLARQVGPLLTKLAIDNYVKPASEGAMGLDNAFRGITVLSLVYILSLAVTLSVGYFQDVLLNTIGQRVMYDLREQIFGKLQSIEVAFYDTNPVGRLITRLTTDVDALNELFTAGLVEVLDRRRAGDDVLFQLAAGAGLTDGRAAAHRGHRLVPPRRARRLPSGPDQDRAAERLHPGAHFRSPNSTALQPRREGDAAIL
jgi:hypothetical protein